MLAGKIKLEKIGNIGDPEVVEKRIENWTKLSLPFALLIFLTSKSVQAMSSGLANGWIVYQNSLV